MVQISEF